MLKYTTRPLSDKTWLKPGRRKASAFSSSWTSTRDLLEKEIRALDGRDVVIEIDVREQDLRLDGTLRSRATADSPAVRVSFESKHGPMSFPCDAYKTGPYQNKMLPWQHNVRAVALTMEALRAAERHGAINTGQQYTGFRALNAGRTAPASHLTYDEAMRTLREISGVQHTTVEGPQVQAMIRLAQSRAHPDRNGGARDTWDLVEESARVVKHRHGWQ